MRRFLVTPIAACCVLFGAGQANAWEQFSITLDPSAAKQVDISGLQTMPDQTAGQFRVNVNAANPGSLLDGSSFYTFCVELTQTLVSPTTAAMNYQIVANTAQVTATKITALEKLFTLGSPPVLTGGLDVDKSSAFQAAVWEIVYETAGSYALGAGNIQFASNDGSDTTQLAWAQGLLNNLGTVSTPLYSLQVLSSSTALGATDARQDYLVITQVPEPEAYGLALAGMGVVAFAMRRNRRASKPA